MTLLIIIICTLTGLGSLTADTFTFNGHVGGDVQIRCSHRNAHNNVKYFCMKPCSTNKDILIKSSGTRKKNTKGRYSIYDEGSGVFTVTISKLKKSDSWTYWCAVERFWENTYYEVILTVREAPVPTSRPTTSISVWTTSRETELREITESKTSPPTTRPATAAPTESTAKDNEIVYIGAGLAALLLLFAVLLFVLIKQVKQRKAAKHQPETAPPSWNQHLHHNPHTENVSKYSPAKTSYSASQRTPSIQNTPTANRRSQADPSSAVYSNISAPPHNSYATVNFTSQPDDLNYSSVIFVRESDSNTSHMKTSPMDMARSSSPVYSTINPTNSSQSEEDMNTVIYATVKKVK